MFTGSLIRVLSIFIKGSLTHSNNRFNGAKRINLSLLGFNYYPLESYPKPYWSIRADFHLNEIEQLGDTDLALHGQIQNKTICEWGVLMIYMFRLVGLGLVLQGKSCR